MNPSDSRPTIEGLISRYRSEISKNSRVDSAYAELEIRLKDVDFQSYEVIYNSLLNRQESNGNKLLVGEPSISQTINIIMNTKQRGDGAASILKPSRIREIYFENGIKTKEQFVKKLSIYRPIRVKNDNGLSYSVSLAKESLESGGFISDESALIRIKSRVSFPLTIIGTNPSNPELLWRVDMTIVRQINGSDADGILKQLVGKMFKTIPSATPANHLTILGLNDERSGAVAREMYKFEVESEFIGPSEYRDLITPQDTRNAADCLINLINPEFAKDSMMHSELYRIATYIIKSVEYLKKFRTELGIKRLLNQALAITRVEYRKIYPPTGMYITIKADGKRAVASVHDGKGIIISDSLLNDYVPPDPIVSQKYRDDTIVDGELTDGGNFYAFDVIAINGVDLSQDGFEKRLDHLASSVKILNDCGIPAFVKEYSKISDPSPSNLRTIIEGTYNAKYPHEIDGLIIVEPGKSYRLTSNYKWKSAENNTIDFLAKRAPSTLLGKHPFIDSPSHKVYLLFVGIGSGMYASLNLRRCPGYEDVFKNEDFDGGYFPIQFTPSDAPLAFVYYHPIGDEIDGKIIELRCTGGCVAAGGNIAMVEWKLVKIRDDRKKELNSRRYYGNDFRTAELIWLNYVDPFPISQLWDGLGSDYFMREKSRIYKAQAGMINFAKTRNISSLSHASWVIDIGSGKGQDLTRYINAEIKNLIVVDKDKAALSELVKRKYDVSERKKIRTNLSVIVADVNDPCGQLIEKFSRFGLQTESADALVCNLAVHYFMNSTQSMNNFVSLASESVRVGGRVILTIMNGTAVHKLFIDNNIPEGGSWDIRENSAIKFSIKRLYSSDTMADAGQKIGVLLPFSNGEHYEENLLNIPSLSRAFAKRGFKAIPPTRMSDLIPEFILNNRSLGQSLNIGDKQYLSLYGTLEFVKTK